jgi:hypothetical protein
LLQTHLQLSYERFCVISHNSLLEVLYRPLLAEPMLQPNLFIQSRKPHEQILLDCSLIKLLGFLKRFLALFLENIIPRRLNVRDHTIIY